MRPIKWHGQEDPENDLYTKRKHGTWDLVQSRALKHPVTTPPVKEGWVLSCATHVSGAEVLEYGSRPRLVLGEMPRDAAQKLAEAVIAKAEGRAS